MVLCHNLAVKAVFEYTLFEHILLCHISNKSGFLGGLGSIVNRCSQFVCLLHRGGHAFLGTWIITIIPDFLRL